MFADFIGDLFTSVTDIAIKVAPTLLPAAASFAAVKLAGGTTQEAFIGAGVAAGVSGMVGAATGGTTKAAGSTIAGGGASADGAKGGALERAGIAEGAISGTGAQPEALLPEAAPKQGLLASLGITGSDLLKAGGQIVASMDDTDDKHRERVLDDSIRRTTVSPVSWDPNSPLMSRVTGRGPGARRF